MKGLWFWIAIIAFGLLFFRYYWKLQLVFDSNSMTFYTPPSMGDPTKFPGLEEDIDFGFQVAKSRKVIITTMVRDVAKTIPLIKKKVERTGKMFGDYRVLIVENDSADGTRETLLQWAKENPKVIILGCGVNAPECKLKTQKTVGHSVDRSRIQKMVDLRNVYLEYIKSSFPASSKEGSGWDYVIGWDLDALGTVYLDGIASSLTFLESDPDIDCVCANGFYHWGAFKLFYDTYAAVDLEEKFHIDFKTLHDIRKGVWEANYSYGSKPVEVRSCFSGFTIYRTSALTDPEVWYEMSDETNLECEHTVLCDLIKGKKFINPSMINLLILNE
jgi:hypothetical protein